MKFFKYHFLFFFWLAAIFVESSFPATAYPKIEIWSADKIVHIGVYGLLAALCYISLIHQSKFLILSRNAFLITIFIVSIYGASDEFHQYFVPNRDCEFWDWLADLAGGLIMIFLIKYYMGKKFSLFKENIKDSAESKES
jgi:VanZ family protein